ncbi:MAG: hypothetical protein DRJ61_03380 [Acidobacteria bacterium]|nr:MAG: hypothetical protein DRJ61_03380 [Acidobacteriota bacterium]
MEDKDLKTWGEQLSQELGEIRTSRRSKRWRCPPELQSRVVSYAKVCRERGEPYFDIAVRLGLVESTLTRWFRTERAKEQPGFRSVSIVRRDVEETTAQPIASRLRLLTPQGYRVEGLDAQTLAYLLRVLP